MNHTQRIKVIKLVEKEGGEESYATDFHNGKLVGICGSPQSALNYAPRRIHWDFEKKDYVYESRDDLLKEHLSYMKLHGEAKDCWCVHSFSVVEIDVVTAYNVASETPIKSL